MATILSHLPLLPLPLSSSSSSISHFSPPFNVRFPCSCRASEGMEPQPDQRPKFKEFPYVAAPIRDLMVELVSTVENRLDSELLPCTLPPDVQYYHNQSGTAHATLFVRSGTPSSSIDFMLGSWLHSKLPNGRALNIASLSSYMNESTDAPQLVMEFIQSSPTSLVLILDLPPRKDLVLHPEYLKTFYEDTGLEKQQQALYKIPEIQPYFSPSLYVRCVSSPVSILALIDTTESGGETRMEEILRDNVSVAAREVLAIWLDVCASGNGRVIDEEEKAYLKKRDNMFKSRTIDIDLSSSLPRLFGQETADKVLGVLRSI